MHKIFLAIFLSACAGRARRVQKQPVNADVEQLSGEAKPLNALAMLLMGGTTAAAFNPSAAAVHLPTSSPIFLGCRPVMKVEAEWDAPPPRVRFAPSPTGVLHVGGARTALFNYLFAKKEGGELILRLEDTDRARSTEESERAIMEGLRWCGIEWDEGPDKEGEFGPYRQTDRIAAGIYQEPLDKLLEEGYVYRCFMTEEELDAMREECTARNETFQVRSPWARASESEIQEMLDKNAPYVYRFRLPRDEFVKAKDLVLGWRKWNTSTLGGDFVIMRSSGVPLYNFAAAVDDSKMGITHVLRAQEHLINTPKQILLYRAMHLATPQFGHMPLLLAPDRSKLSKRHGAASVQDFKAMGIIPDGMANYLSMLGWSSGTDQEIFDLNELIEAFTIDRMRSVNAIFDKVKLGYVNQAHFRRMSEEVVIREVGGHLVDEGVVKSTDGVFVRKLVLFLQERIEFMNEASTIAKDMLRYPLKEMLADDFCKQFLEDGDIAETAKLLIEARTNGKLEELEKNAESAKDLTKWIGKERGAKGRKLFMPVRICLTGANSGPDLSIVFDILDEVDDNVIAEYVPLKERIEILEEEMKALA